LVARVDDTYNGFSSVYDIQRAMEDKATVLLYSESQLRSFGIEPWK
jgi:hypothetical protein